MSQQRLSGYITVNNHITQASTPNLSLSTLCCVAREKRRAGFHFSLPGGLTCLTWLASHGPEFNATITLQKHTRLAACHSIRSVELKLAAVHAYKISMMCAKCILRDHLLLETCFSALNPPKTEDIHLQLATQL